MLRDRCAALDAAAQERQAQLHATTAERAAVERAHAGALADAQHRCEALSKQLLQETAHQREALKKEHAHFASQLKFAERRVATLAACDAWVAEGFNDDDALVVARRGAIWTLYRYAGVRLVELVWSDDAQLPNLEVDDGECWTLHVLGKGRKTRAVPLSGLCVPIPKTYRQLRGLSPQPSLYEHAALIHGLKGGSLHSSGLYDEVKAIFIAAADRIEKTDHAGAARLRSASPHWLRHGYAR